MIESTVEKFGDAPYKHLLPEGVILLGYRGSIAHGTYDPHEHRIDDKDLMGVHVNPIEHYFGYRQKSRETIDEFEGVWDVVSHEVRKFVRLLNKNNPNVMDLLWLPDDMILYRSEPGNMLIENRDLWVSKRAYRAFKGYAHSQYDKLERDEYHGYMGEKRRKLVDEYGYDIKHASHLIRLLRMGIEFLDRGRIILPRPDADELIAIKRGEWTFRQVCEEADRLLESLEEAYRTSQLPVAPDRDRIEQVLVRCIKCALSL